MIEKKDEFGSHIISYINEKENNSSLLITGGWGSGKTYYIKKDFLKKLEEEGIKIKIIYVSLFGITKIEEISKIILIKNRIQNKWKWTKKKGAQWAKVCGEIISKNIFGWVNFDISLSSKSINNIMNASNFSDTLIIFDDFERTKIDRTEITGYINNLSENNNAKTIVICDETKIKCNDWENLKEKSFYNVLKFQRDFDDVVDLIFDSYNNPYINYFKESYISNKIKKYKYYSSESEGETISTYLVKNIIKNDKNIRKLKYACLKFIDFIKRYNSLLNNKNTEENFYFMSNIFEEIIKYCYKKKDNNQEPLEEGGIYLTTPKTTSNNIGKLVINNEFAEEFFKSEYNLFLENQKDAFEILKDEYRILENYYIYQTIDVNNAIRKTNSKLNKIKEFDYGFIESIYATILKLSSFKGLKKSCQSCLKKIEKNIYKIKIEKFFYKKYIYENENDKNEIMKFRLKVNDYFKKISKEKFDISYDIDGFDNFINNFYQNLSEGAYSNYFLSRFNINLFIKVMKKMDNKRLFNIRSMLRHVYGGVYNNLSEYYEDLNYMIDLKSELLKSLNEFIDDIGKNTISCLIGDLSSWIEKLKSYKTIE